jgi:hypothetical protein
METKSNEKLTAQGIEHIELFYLKLTELWKVCPIPFKVKMSLLFRKIMNAGKNPDELNTKNNGNNNFDESLSPQSRSNNPFSNRSRVTDKEYIMERMKLSGALMGIVSEFNYAAEQLDYKLGGNSPDGNSPPVNSSLHAKASSYDAAENDAVNDTNAASFPSPSGANAKWKKNMTYEEELAFCGVIKPKAVISSGEPSSSSENDELNGDSPLGRLQRGNSYQDLRPEQTLTEEEEPEIIINKAVLRELTQHLLNLCLDITNANNEATFMMFEYGLTDGIVLLLNKDFSYDNRDKRISYDIELLWNLLESFMDKIKLEYENSTAVAVNHPSLPPIVNGSHTESVFSLEGGALGAGNGNNEEISSAVKNLQKINVVYHSFILNHELTITGNDFSSPLATSSLINLEIAIKTLYEILFFLINDGFRQSDKELRNEIIIILTLLAEFPFSIGHFIHTELIHLLLTYSCVEEIGKGKWPFFLKFIANSRNFGTINDSDLEFKKLIWNFFTVLCKFNDVDLLLALSASPLVPCLLNYLEYQAPEQHGNGNHSVTKGGGTGTLMTSSAIHPSKIFGGGGMAMSGSIMGKGNENHNASFLENSEILVSKSLQLPPTGGIGGGGSMSKSIVFNPIATTTAITNHQNSSTGNDITMKGNQIKKSLIAQLSPSKLKEFQIQASLFLLLNGNKFLCEIERFGGIPRVITLLLSFSTSDHADHRIIVFNLIMFLHKAITNSFMIRSYMENNQGIAILLHLFGIIHSSLGNNSSGGGGGGGGGSSNNVIIEETCAQIIRVISLLCDPNNRICQEQFTLLNGINILLSPIKTYVTKRPPIIGLKAGLKIINDADLNDPYIDPLDNPFGGEISVLIIAIIDCFSKAVMGNSQNELIFAEMEGIDLIFDLLEISSFILRIHILRLISDLLYNPLLISFVYSWRSSKTLRSASQLVCHSWLDEESRLNGERNASNGIICNLMNALGNQSWPLADFEIPLLGGSQTLSLTLANTTSPLLNAGMTAGGFGTEGTGMRLGGMDSSSIFTGGFLQNNGGIAGQSSSSVIVSKLATAILAGRNAIQTNLPIDISLQVLQYDSRIILSNIFQSLRLFEIYQIENELNPYKVNSSNLNDQQHLVEQSEVGEGERSLSPSASNPNIVTNHVITSNNDTFSQQLSPQYNPIIKNKHQLPPSATSPNNAIGGGGLNSPSAAMSYHSTTNINFNNIIHGFDEIKLTPKEKQVLSIAKKYIMLRESDWWKNIYHSLQMMGVTPIESDMALIDMRLEYSFDTSIALQVEQMKLYNENEYLKKQNENNFINQILTKKNQQIKAEWLKKNAKGGFKKKNSRNTTQQGGGTVAASSKMNTPMATTPMDHHGHGHVHDYGMTSPVRSPFVNQ